MEEKDDYFCPLPPIWSDICGKLCAVWEKEGSNPADKPPVPLILAAWYDTPGLMKLLRWKDTIAWAQRHNCSHLIPELKENEKFRG